MKLRIPLTAMIIAGSAVFFLSNVLADEPKSELAVKASCKDVKIVCCKEMRAEVCKEMKADECKMACCKPKKVVRKSCCATVHERDGKPDTAKKGNCPMACCKS